MDTCGAGLKIIPPRRHIIFYILWGESQLIRMEKELCQRPGRDIDWDSALSYAGSLGINGINVS